MIVQGTGEWAVMRTGGSHEEGVDERGRTGRGPREGAGTVVIASMLTNIFDALVVG